MAARWASRSPALICGFSPGLWSFPRKPSSKTTLVLVEAEPAEESAVLALGTLSFFGSYVIVIVIGSSTAVRFAWLCSKTNALTLALGFAASFAPNDSEKARSTVFFSSRGFAHRSSGEVFKLPMTAPRFAQPDTALVLMYSKAFVYSSSGVMLKPSRIR